MTTPAIQTEDLARIFEPKRARGIPDRTVHVALDGISLEVQAGQLFGLLGPNGAGKTTLIKILTTLLLPSRGTARVAGFDVVRQTQQIRERIAVVSGGETSGYGLLTVREQLYMFTRFYGMPSKESKRRIDELLELVGLADAAHRKIHALSTGMRQKMNLVRGLLSDPDIFFLDEPTVGLDVGAARDIRDYVRRWMDERPGRTILLTTHYLHEADELCDRVAIIHKGKIIADDTPHALRRRDAGGSLFQVTTEALGGAPVLDSVPGVQRAETWIDDGRAHIRVHLESDAAIAGVVRALGDHGRTIQSLEKIEPTLEDVFVEIVGQRLEEADEKRSER